MPYDPDFIPGERVDFPILSDRVRHSALALGEVVDHSRFSLVFNQVRGFAAVTAHNIDGATLLPAQVTDRDFELDPKIKPDFLQVDNDRGYRNNPWDRGHMVRRKSMSWGDRDEAGRAELESDYYSNICPQHTTLHSRSWGKIEDWMLDRAEEGQRACVFTGPIFTDEDPLITNSEGQTPVRIPAGFWKIISVKSSGMLRSAAFLVWQRDYDSAQPLPFSPVLEQVRITTIEILTGLAFPNLRRFDPLLFERVQPVAPRTRSFDFDVADEEPLPGVDRGSNIYGKEDILL